MAPCIDPLRDTPSAAAPAVPVALELLRQRGASHVTHPGGDLLSHLRRTARRLTTWGADPVLAAAGACHAAYGTHGFAAAPLRLSERAVLREALGEEVESLVYAYCALDRARTCVSDRELRDRFNGEYWVPNARMRRQLAELTAANELDIDAHAAPDTATRAAIGELLSRCAPYLSAPARDACREAACGAYARPALATLPDDPAIAYIELGTSGPAVVLWHGGAGPQLTWARQHALGSILRLRIPWRRGFAPSAPCARQDWEVDSRDLLRVMHARAHVVGHSYGALSALVAAAVAPERFASLTLIEPPLWSIAPDLPQVQQLAALSRAFIRGQPEARSAFLRLAALPEHHAEVKRIERLARDLRDPGEAQPDLLALSDRVPVVVASGGHAAGVEQLCDALSERLNAQRWTLPGAGHAVQRHPAFNQKLTALIAKLGQLLDRPQR